MPLRAVLVAAFCVLTVIPAARAEQLRVLAAGSLREVVGEIVSQYRKQFVEIVAEGFLVRPVCCASASRKASASICLPRPISAIRSRC